MSLEFEKRTEKSHGGIPCDKIEIAPALKVSFPPIIDGVYTDQPTLSGSTVWEEFHFIEKTGRFNETIEVIDGAEVFVQELSCLINGTGPYQTAQLNKIRKKKLQIKLTDRSGLVKVMGGPSTYASLIVQGRDEKTLPDERREYSVVFRAVSAIPATVLP